MWEKILSVEMHRQLDQFLGGGAIPTPAHHIHCYSRVQLSFPLEKYYLLSKNLK